jgi:hypothetical protein
MASLVDGHGPTEICEAGNCGGAYSWGSSAGEKFSLSLYAYIYIYVIYKYMCVPYFNIAMEVISS